MTAREEAIEALLRDLANMSDSFLANSTATQGWYALIGYRRTARAIIAMKQEIVRE